MALVVVALVGCGGGSKNSGGGGGGTKQSGGTAYWAEAPQATPNYIFPFASFSYFSVANLTQFQELMYRPLYWFGKGATPNLNSQLSLAQNANFSSDNKTVTVTLKTYQWSNGEKMTPQDVIFWLNMMKVEKRIWAGYVPGTIPDNISSIDTSGNALTFHLTAPANKNWFIYNELSQITPMPMAWDVSADGQKSGSQECGTASFADVTTTDTKDSKGNTTTNPVSSAAKSCAAVYTYLDAQAKKISSYASSPIWSVVDGPWTLKGGSMDTSGNVTFVPNTKYSGPIKPTLAKFVELPYTSDSAEFNALAANKVDVGYLPSQDITSPASPGSGPCNINLGANNARLASNYDLVPQYSWSINYFPYNFTSAGNGGQAGAIFKKSYFRQAFQTLVNQPLYIKQIDKGYGVPTYGPVPVCPTNSFATSTELDNPYAYSVTKAKSLLTANGWTVKPGGTTTCTDAAKCGVPAGTPLSFNLQYAGGTAAIDQLMASEKSSWAQAGIQVKLTSATFDTVIGTAVPCSGSSCTWQLENWGGGWIFAPDYYPSGEDLFQTGASSNGGQYSNPQADSLIMATTQGNANLAAYENYVAKDLPVVWQPNALAVGEISKKLQGVGPPDPLLTLNPETWYFTK
ncbi:MAG TPA: ABC transporter substrate-binding protein [Gaiellaceae bacterium]|jgi:peptide/nickel transport system substrate-binding protein